MQQKSFFFWSSISGSHSLVFWICAHGDASLHINLSQKVYESDYNFDPWWCNKTFIMKSYLISHHEILRWVKNQAFWNRNFNFILKISNLRLYSLFNIYFIVIDKLVEYQHYNSYNFYLDVYFIYKALILTTIINHWLSVQNNWQHNIVT